MRSLVGCGAGVVSGAVKAKEMMMEVSVGREAGLFTGEKVKRSDER